MSPSRHRTSTREVAVESVSVNPVVLTILSSALLVAIVRAVSQYFVKRPTTAVAVWQSLVNELQEDAKELRQRLDKVEARNMTMAMAAEEREAALVVRLKAVKDANEIRIQSLYAELNEARLRIEALELENKRLRAQLNAMRGTSQEHPDAASRPATPNVAAGPDTDQ